VVRKVAGPKASVRKTTGKAAPQRKAAQKKVAPPPKRRAQPVEMNPAKKLAQPPTRAAVRSEVARVREALLAKRAETLSLLERASDYSKKRLREDAEDIVDQATDSQARDVVHALSSAEGHMIRSIDGALERLEDGDYGTCLSCQESIQSRRLLAVPWATLCVECQELQEQGILFAQ
jgi:DnaK suppressor protein